MYNVFGIDKDGCAENIARVVGPHGVAYEDIPDTMDLFMNCYRDVENQRWVYLEPITEPGDYIEFRAEMHCLVGMSNCPEDTLSDTNCRTSAPTLSDTNCRTSAPTTASVPFEVEVFEPEA